MAASTALQCLVSAASLAAGSPLHRAAVAFGEALGARMMRSLPGLALALQLQAPAPPTLAAANAARQSFAALCPPVRVAATAANHVILEAMAAEQWVHIVDLSGASTSQWIELLHLFATRPGGPPSLRLTVVNDQDDFLAQAAGLLTQEAVRLHVPFMFMPVRSHIDRMLLPSAASLNVVPGLGEALVISSTLQLHRLIADELTITLPPAAVSNNDQELTTTTTTKQITKADGLLHALSELKPKLLVLTEHEVDHNSPDLSDRVPNAFDYYTVLYRDLEGLGFVDRVTVEHVLLREEVMDIVTSDGVQRRERHEVMARWEQRMQVAGFQPAQVNISAGKAAARLARQLNNGGLSMFMTHKADKGCLFVCSRNKPLFAVSAWVPVPSE
ncbi:hypothetical protein PR202_ga04465 [Eleusine coracana subsp. coracana]|uniref:Uncharacterized protein n=1 Tax=Eleusine coracana subsp. coracana TaxID=191504 RepID=A0AAV5BSC8_ELECO|nr:hypothetical protein PR202_ga04465 [Eleusine coracana subsp. coracana]